MTPVERKREWTIAYETALGRSCGSNPPSDRQRHSAKIEADEHIAALELEEWREKQKRKTK